jgi:hypothetical protein
MTQGAGIEIHKTTAQAARERAEKDRLPNADRVKSTGATPFSHMLQGFSISSKGHIPYPKGQVRQT